MRKHALGLLALISIASINAKAEAPLATTEAATQQVGNCHLDFGGERQRTRASGYTSNFNVFEAGVGCGATRTIDWDANVYHYNESGIQGQGLHFGPKLRLWGDAGDASQLSLRGLTGFSRYEIDGDTESSWDGMAFVLAFSQTLGAGNRLDLNLITATRAGHWEHPSWAAAYTHRLGAEWDLIGEVTGGVHQKPSLSAGARWKLAKEWELSALVTRHGVPDAADGSSHALKINARWKF